MAININRPQWLGAGIRRREDPTLLRGRGRYVDDTDLPGQLYMAVARSIHGHARIVGIDTGAAASVPGVVRVVTGAEVAARTHPFPHQAPGLKPLIHHALAVDRVRYVGEPVAVVVADNPYVAEDAVQEIRVDYDPLPVVVSARQALEPDAPLLFPEWGDNVILQREFSAGDPGGVLARADLVVRETFSSARHTGMPMEPRACLAHWSEAGLTLWSNTQWPHVQRTVLSEVLGVPEHQIRTIAPHVGGAFGIKHHVYGEEVLVCWLSRLLGRPVKWLEDRREHFIASVHAREKELQVVAGFDRAGKLLAVQLDLINDVGAGTIYYPGIGPALVAAGGLPRPYQLDHYSYRVRCVVTNKTPSGAYRGFGYPAGVFVMERIMDMAAERLGIDPVELRRRNLVRTFPYRNVVGAVYDSGSYLECLERAAEAVGYASFRKRQAQGRVQGRYLGIGFACYVESTGTTIQALTGRWGGWDSADLTMEADGTLTLSLGIAAQGQGHETTMAQVVAEAFGVNPERVTVRLGDTATTPYGLGAFASRSAVFGGATALLASERLKAKLRRIAGHLLEVSPDDLEFRGDATIGVRGVPGRGLTLAELARIAYLEPERLPPGEEPGLRATASWRSPDVQVRPDESGRINPSPTYSNATHAVTVEVDPDTGEVRILDYFVAHDCGRVINPVIVDGQIAGGVAQGIGGALYEELVYDRQGQLLTATFMDYLLPSATEMPPIHLDHLETPAPNVPGGFKGMGEGGAIGPAAALANAVSDALRPLGIQIRETPITPTRLRAMIEEHGG